MNESLGSNQSSAYRPIQPDFTSGPTPYVPRAAQRTSRSVERPIHVEMSPQRAYSQSTSPAQYGRGTQSYVSPRAMPQGTDSSTYYPPSHHHERRLSPSASIQHLQYNSPIKLYSPSAAAEQYRQQTGGLFGTDPIVGKEQNAPYLSSGTRQLIAEQEQGLDLHHHSAPAQSPCFKRISRAQGTPVD
ncbi:hypothetical protein AB6A40_009986 [Gnathostoma spinigerum]|uniref:Zasp-like motif domain-containing protein n=1 Tax=Gnathostoma spinigerum TaxID=75299 RepID=A0ABD6EVZ4_9BILA